MAAQASKSSYECDENLLKTWKKLKVRRKFRWLTFKLNPEESKIVVDQEGARYVSRLVVSLLSFV